MECPDWCPVCGAELKAQGWPIKHQHETDGGECSFNWSAMTTQVFPPVLVVLSDAGRREGVADPEVMSSEEFRELMFRRSRGGL